MNKTQTINTTRTLWGLFALGIALNSFFGCARPETEKPVETPSKAESLSEATARPESEIRAVWVSVLGPGLKSPGEIKQLIETVRRANLNTIVAQVHREGAAMFKSTIQPRHASIAEQADFDPLATLLKEARDTRDGSPPLKIHAWFNSFKIGEQKGYLRSNPKPIALNHPDWYTRNWAGEAQFELEPGLPSVQNHMIAVIEECLQNYDVDGVNLDFIRYFGNDRGYHPLALKRFYQKTGIAGRPAIDDEAWSDFRRDQVSNFVKRCAISVWTYRPKAIFSVDATGWGAAPVKDFSETQPYLEALQDWSGWSEKGWVDLVLKMGYKRDWIASQAKQFRDWADYNLHLIERSEGRMVTIGIGGYFNPMPDGLNQYREALKRGLGTCLFSYDRPTQEAADSGPDKRGHHSPLWNILGKVIYPESKPAPLPVWRKHKSFIAGFLTDESGLGMDGGSVSLSGTHYQAKSDGAGFFAFYGLPVGTYKLIAPGTTVDGKTVTTQAGQVTWIE